jgi:hypothetical protein
VLLIHQIKLFFIFAHVTLINIEEACFTHSMIVIVKTYFISIVMERNLFLAHFRLLIKPFIFVHPIGLM